MCILCIKSGKRVAGHMPMGASYQYSNRVEEANALDMTLSQYMRGKNRWVSLHGHSEFSLLDGGAKVEDIFRKASIMGQDSVAITDHGNLFGAVKAHKIAQKYGIKHIVGCELYLTPVGMTMAEKSFKKGEKAYHHLVVLAKNKTGYQNLCKLSSIGYSNGFYRAPRVDRDALKAHKEGLIITSSCVGGSIPMNAFEGEFYKAESDMDWFMREFGDDFYVEIQNHGTEIEDRAFTYMREIAGKYRSRLVITTDAHYLDEEDNVTHDALLCIGTGQTVDQKDRRFKFEGSGFHYMAEEEVRELFPYDEEAIYRTGEIADKIDDQVIDFGAIKLPSFEIPDDEGFKSWAINGGAYSWLK